MAASYYSRRRFINRNFSFIVAILGIGTTASSCNDKAPENGNKAGSTDNKATAKPAPCDDLSALSEKELEPRKKLGYVKESPIAESTCNKCNLFLPAASDSTCGGCMLFKGPVHASGYCTYWTARQDQS